MNRPTIMVFPDRAKLNEFGAQKIQTASEEAIADRGVFRIALSGGSTPKALYALLAEEPYRSSIRWNDIHFFWSDERCVPPEHPESNFRLAWETLLSRIPVEQTNIHRMHGEDQDPQRAASDYEQEIRNFFQVPAEQIPQFDLILLGMGDDGHTASLFPFSPALEVTDRLVTANYVERLASTRLTFTAKLINEAACVMMMVSGKSKARALKEVLEGPYDPKRLPAQLIRPRSGELIYLIEAEAASELSRNP